MVNSIGRRCVDQPSNPQFQPMKSVSLTCLLLCPSIGLAQAVPPPGLYRLDLTSTTRWVTPMGVMERVEQTDGATGRVTVTTTAPSEKPVVTVYPGDGPRTECQGPAASIATGNCVAKSETHGDSLTASFTCAGRAQQISLRKISQDEWEKTLKSKPAPTSPQTMAPQVAQAMAPVIEKMEAQARIAPPAEAAALRQQIAAIRGGGAPASNEPEIESVQRWTRISSACKADAEKGKP
jgi:hypothetical protein